MLRVVFYVMLGFLLFMQMVYISSPAAVDEAPVEVYRYNMEVKFAWLPAADGPEFYNIRIYDNESVVHMTTQEALDPTAPQCTFIAEGEHVYQVAVQPADEFGETGPWSPLSQTYTIHKLSQPPQAEAVFKESLWLTDWLSPDSPPGVVRCFLGNFPANYTASDIDASSIELNGVMTPVRARALETGHAGLSSDPVLYLHIPTREAVASLGTTVPGIYPVVIAGKFFDNEMFEARTEIVLTGAAASRPLPEAFSVGQNFPNAFNPDTWIPYALPKDADVTIEIYDIHGKRVRRLDLGFRVAGYYDSKGAAAYWDGRNELGEKLTSGIYFLVFRAGDYTAARKMVMRK
jgi:hypothetical protein